MKIPASIHALIALVLFSSGVFGQVPITREGPGNSALNTDKKNSNAPIAGRNSFTEGQAKGAIEHAGYSDISELKKDDNGVWRGRASKKGVTYAVTVDYQGNVNAAY